MMNPTKMYNILMDSKKINSKEANTMRRILGYMIGETIFQPDVGIIGDQEGAVDQSEALKESIQSKRAEAVLRNLSGIEQGMPLKYDF